ncbi:hypothetical protein HMI54_000274 [Coelomomyces lativittatus]|nr:hypothetical protein HMI54_000274 [Coelomomyces lativittatus]
MPTILGEISKSSPLGVATMKLTRMTSTDTLTMKHVELPGSPPHSLKEKEIPVNTINKPISNLNPTPPPLLSEGKSMTSFKDRNTSFISIPDTILSSVSNKLDAEALAWKEVPSILRSTIKQILLVLREHGQVIEQTLPKLPTSHSEDVSSVLKELKTKVDILETQRQEDRTYFEQRLQEQSIKHQLQLQAKETLWMQRMDEVLQQQQKHTTSVEIDRSLVDPENHLKWEVLSERVKELEVRLFGGHRKASQKSFFEIPFPFTSTHFKPTTDSVQVLPGSIKSVRDEETQDPNEKLPELTDRLDHLYHQLSILEGKCQTNEDAWKVLQLQLKQENRHLNLNSEEAQMSKNPSLKLSLSSKHIQSTIQTEVSKFKNNAGGKTRL